jgi:hypothetical protein
LPSLSGCDFAAAGVGAWMEVIMGTAIETALSS